MKQTTLKLIAALSIAVMGFGSLAPAEAATYNKRITIHYHRQAGDFSGWYAWMWQYKKTQPAAYTFKSTTQYWTTGTFTVANSSKAKTIAFYMGQARGLPKDTYNQTRYLTDFTSKGRAEIWIVQGDPEIYTYEPDVIPRIQSAKIDAMNKITVSLNLPFGNVVDGDANGFTITGPGGITVTDVDANEAGTQLTLTTSANLTLSGAYTLHHNKYIDNPLQIGQVLTSDSFNELYIYDGDDLGNTYTPERTDFRVWAPTASEAKLLVYADAAPSTTPTETAMTASVNGTWIAHLDGDQDGTIYTYKVKIGENWNEAVDPYVRTSTVNGQRGVVVDLTSTDPAGFRESTSPEFSGELSDAIFYELHVRDLSMDDSSGIPDQYKGKFLALTQAGTETPDGLSKTGIDAIADLGVTHLQLLPIYDYNSVDETTRDQFNWGYDPLNYNVVEGSYATNPEDPKNRVNELKQTVQYIHSRGLRVIMDVVYNHVASAPNHSFEALVPGYYFRLDAGGGYADGTYCGNEVASDHPMARKYIVESVKYWASQYKLDGFRFDLMGILDIQTMNEVRAALDEIDPTILIIGEGWNIGSTLADDLKAAQPNITQLPRIGMFNDTIRDGIKGSTFNAGEKGWASGSGTNKSAVMAGIVGNTLFSNEVAGGWGAMDPGQSVNYVEAHDNMTLRDKLEASMGLDMPSLKNVFRLSSSIVLLAQGLPFIHAGQEFLRTKGGDENSYESGDEVNSLKWDQRARNMSTVNYFKGLIALRKAHPAFRLRTTEQVQQVLKFGNPPSNVISYRLSGYLVNDSWSTIFVVHNANTKSVKVKLPKIGDWKLVVDRTRAGTEVLQTFTNAEFVTVTGQSTFVLYK